MPTPILCRRCGGAHESGPLYACQRCEAVLCAAQLGYLESSGFHQHANRRLCGPVLRTGLTCDLHVEAPRTSAVGGVAMLAIETTWLDNFFAIRGGTRATSVGGYHDEWREVAKALREGRNVSFKRLAAARQQDGSYHLWSPRNAWGDDDHETCDAPDVAAFADQIDAYLDANMPKPTVVCLCGSTRFRDEFIAANERLTLEGKIVLAPGCFSRSTPEQAAAGIFAACTAEQKVALDELHLRKIDLADEVLVLNVGGYIGDSTRREIEYARAHGKPIDLLYPYAGLDGAPPSRVGGLAPVGGLTPGEEARRHFNERALCYARAYWGPCVDECHTKHDDDEINDEIHAEVESQYWDEMRDAYRALLAAERGEGGVS